MDDDSAVIGPSSNHWFIKAVRWTGIATELLLGKQARYKPNWWQVIVEGCLLFLSLVLSFIIYFLLKAINAFGIN